MAHLGAGFAGSQALLSQVLAPDVDEQPLVARRHGARHSVVAAPPRQPLHNHSHLRVSS